jgi:hypothetical protein
MTTTEREKFDAAMFDIMNLSLLMKMAVHGVESDHCDEFADTISLAFGAAARLIGEKAQEAHSLATEDE